MNDALVRWLMTGDEHDLPALEDFLRRPEWHQRAACRGVGLDGFFAGRGGTYSREVREGCPVRQECLEGALADPELIGLWGGTSDRERRAMRRENAA